MSLTGGSKFILTGGANYQIARSLRFRSSASAYLTRTAAAGNQKTFTLSFWKKIAAVSTGPQLFCGYSNATNLTQFGFENPDAQMSMFNYVLGVGQTNLVTRWCSAIFRRGPIMCGRLTRRK